MFTTNVGTLDRMIRFLLGAGAIVAGYAYHNVFGYIVGGILIVTGFVKFCPVWAIFGVKTNKSEPASRSA